MLINLKEHNNIFVTSDFHIKHSNLCIGTSKWNNKNENCRNFNNADEMSDIMIRNINSLIKENDTLIHLGDVSFGKIKDVNEFFDKINCKRIILINGNHDHFPIKHSKIALQCDYLEVRLDCGTLVCMFHYPIACWNEQHRGSVCLHGHTHLKYKGNGRIKDVEMNGNNMFPYELITVVKDLCKIPVFTVHSVH